MNSSSKVLLHNLHALRTLEIFVFLEIFVNYLLKVLG